MIDHVRCLIADTYAAAGETPPDVDDEAIVAALSKYGETDDGATAGPAQEYSTHAEPHQYPVDDAPERGGHDSGGRGPAPADDQVALSGGDGEEAERLLDTAKNQGALVLSVAAAAAVRRLLEHPERVKDADVLFNQTELDLVESALERTCGTAELLGRARILNRADSARKHGEAFEAAEAESPFRVFDECGSGGDPTPRTIHPLAPTAAVAWFRRLVPTVRVRLPLWERQQRENAFTLAVTTDQTLLERVKEIVARALETGEVTHGPALVQHVLDEAGVSPKNPQYSEMVVRTNMMNSFNRGLQEEMRDPDVAATFPVWQWRGIADGRERPSHRVHFNKYFDAATRFEDVRDSVKGSYDGFNDRCVLPGAKISGMIRTASKAWYSGEAVELITRRGTRLAVTINHPVLTEHGFVAAGSIKQGDNLVCHVRENNGLANCDDVDNAPVVIDQIFETFAKFDRLRVVKSWSTLDFHGDGASIKGEVDIVSADGLLRLHGDRQASQGVRHTDFGWADIEELCLSGGCPGHRGRYHGGRGCRPTKVDAGLLKAVGDGATAYSKAVGNGLDGLSGQVSGLNRCDVHLNPACVYGISDPDVLGDEFGAEGLLVDAGAFGDRCERLARFVASNQAVQVGDRFCVPGSQRLGHGPKLDVPGQRSANRHERAGELSGYVGEAGSSVVSQSHLFDGEVPLEEKPGGFGLAANSNAPGSELLAKLIVSDAHLHGQFPDGFTGNVSFDQVVDVIEFHYDGPVYDLLTTQGYYSSSHSGLEGIVIKNCQPVPVSKFRWKKLQAAGASVSRI